MTLVFRDGFGGYHGTSGLEYLGTGGRRTSETPFLWADWPDPKSRDADQRGCAAILRFDDLVGRRTGRIPPDATIIRVRLRIVTGVGTAPKGHGARVYRLRKPIEFKNVFDTLLRDAESDRSEIIAGPTAWAGSPTLQSVVRAGPIELDVTADVQDLGIRDGESRLGVHPLAEGHRRLGVPETRLPRGQRPADLERHLHPVRRWRACGWCRWLAHRRHAPVRR